MTDHRPRTAHRASFRERLGRPGWLVLGAIVIGAAVGTMPRWGGDLLSRLDFFRLRNVEISGTRYLAPEEVMTLLEVDTTMSIWNDISPLRRRILQHPQVQDARLQRRLPGTISVFVDEKLPVALVATHQGMQPFDSAGLALPIDPARVPLDLPVLYSPDSALLAAMGRIAAQQPALFARLNSARREGKDAMILDMDSIRVRAQLGVSASRLADIFPVEFDLARRGAHLAELDLRYRDQVIARLK